MRDFSVFTSVVCFLLGGFVATCEAEVHIYPQPGNTTACRGSNVTIDCGYLSSKSFPIMWMINGSSYNGTAILNSPLYQQNINQPSEANAIYSLTVLSINNTTTFQCVVQSIPIATSSRGTVTVIDVPMVEITATGECGYVRVSWTVIGSNDICPVHGYTITLFSSTMDEIDSFSTSTYNQLTFNGLPYDSLFYVTLFIQYKIPALSDSLTTSVRTKPVQIIVTAHMKINNNIIVISVSWQPPSCITANIVMYKITVMDGYNSVNVTVPANMSSVEISEFPDNGTSIVANGEYTITVSAISDQGKSYPSDSTTVSANINNGDSNSGGSSAGAIAGGVIGGIIAVVVIVIIIIVIYYFGFYKKKSKSLYHDDTMNLKSPTSTDGSHASGGDAYYDKVVYSDPSQSMTVPHQTSAAGDLYAVSTKATNYVNQEQLPSQEYDDTCNTKKDNQGVTYADLQTLPTNSEKNMLDDLTPAVTYSEIAQ